MVYGNPTIANVSNSQAKVDNGCTHLVLPMIRESPQCHSTYPSRIMTDGEDEEREMRLLFCLQDVFDKVVNLWLGISCSVEDLA